MKIFKRIAVGWHLAVASWKVILDHKVLMLFPLFSGIASIMAFLVLITGGAVLGLNEQVVKLAEDYATVAYLGALFFTYMVFNTITIFFNVALISCASRALSAQKPGVMQGLADAFARIHFVLLWAAISSSVAVLLNILERQKLLGKILKFILGSLWSVLTYLVLPIMVFEQVNPFKAIGRSKDLIFQTWGEGLAGHVGTGIMTFVLLLPIIPMFMVAGVLEMPSLIFVAMGWLFIVMLWSATANTVIRVAIYGYAAKIRLRTDYFDDLGAVFYGGEGGGSAVSRGGRMDMRLRTSSGDTELHKAVDDGNLPVIKIMVDRGADLNACDAQGRTPMRRAMDLGHIDIAQYFYDEMEKAKENPFETQ